MGRQLDIVLAAAVQSTGVDEAHEHLMKQCPWYTSISKGENPGDPETHCKPADGKVKLTPRTAEASTVPEPIGKPGGSGLWHVKGMQLPPYLDVQHLAHHLIGKYGESRGIAMAKGIIAKWKQGINPGGRHKKGKVSHVHPDVQAAASKAIAQWEEKRETAHEQSREHDHVKATVALAAGQPTLSKPEANYRAGGKAGHQCGDCSMARNWRAPDFESGDCTLVKGLIEADHVCDHFEAKKGKVALAGNPADGEDASASGNYPGHKQLPLPPVPSTKIAKSMYIAHRVDGTLYHLAHAAQRLMRAKENRDLRGYHMIHVNNHLNFALGSGHELVADLKKNFPAEAREWDAMAQTMGLSKSLSPDTKVATFVHLLQTILYDETHAKRHALVMLDPSKTSDAEWNFNFDHAKKHMQGAAEHCFKLAKHIRDNYPEISRWFSDLAKAEDPNDPYTGLTAAQEDGDKRPQATVKLARPAETAPGAKPVNPRETPPDYGLHRQPYSPAGAPIALPPGASPPTAAELRKLAGMVPECSDASLSSSARKHLETAAGMLEHNGSVVDVLRMLRAAENDAFVGHKTDLGATGQSYYTANVFAKTIPPAETSSATASMLASQKQRLAWRALQHGIAMAIDKTKRHFFHGQLGSWSTQARFTQEADMDALDKVLRLAAELEGVGLAAPPLHAKAAVKPDAHQQHVAHEQHLAAEHNWAAKGEAAWKANQWKQHGKPDAHQLHEDHLAHLHRLHEEHVAHLSTLHTEHVAHLQHLARTSATPPKTPASSSGVAGGVAHHGP